MLNYVHMSFITLLCTITLMAHAIENRYQITDLEILKNERSYFEFFDHALDIRPSLRDIKWKSMVESLGIDFLDELTKKTIIDKTSMNLVYKLSNWPVFIGNEFFIKKRDSLFLRQLQVCYSGKKRKKTTCHKLSEHIYNDYKHDLVFSYDIVNLLVKYNVSHKKLWSFSKNLVSNKMSEFYCDKKDFKKIILNEIYRDISINKELKLDIHRDCFKSLTTDLRKDIVSTKDHQRNGAHEALKAAKAIQKKDSSAFYILEYLSKDQLDHNKVDNSINNLKDLAKNYQLRKTLLNTLNKLDPLPDSIFSTDLPNKNPIKTRLLFRHFPEYIDFYVKTCLSYLKGTKTFPHGNPTPNCHSLFVLNKSLKILPESFKIQYKKATSFAESKN